MPMAVEVHGIKGVQKRLDKLKGRMIVTGDTDVIRMWGTTSEAIAKTLVPVDTGHLKGHIRYKRISEFEALVGVAGVPYAKYVEYGTSRYHSFDVREGFAGYRPYLRPAVYIALRELKKKILEYLRSV